MIDYKMILFLFLTLGLKHSSHETSDLAHPDDFPVESSYKGPHVQLPLTQETISNLTEFFKKKKVNKIVCIIL